MSLERNKAVVTRFYTEANDAQRYAVLDEICRPDVIIHDPLAGEQRGVEAFKGLLAFFRQGFPEQKTELQQFVAEGDYVTLLHIHHAVNSGPFNGMPPTGRTVVVPGNELFRLENGKIAEFWRFDADLNLMMQLGAIPAPTGV
ncbi:MAG TPA: ester cyclase [Anaerolineae bacterium]|nr:ester cyclase [Anaerolineae bacterium]